MTNKIVARLCLHGSIVMFFAFVSGMMMGMVAMGQITGSVDNWKLAHMECLVNSIVLLAVAGFINNIVVSPGKATVASWCLIGMAYSNTVFGYMRGMTGALGYQFDDSLANNIAAFAGMLGVPLAIVAFVIIFSGAWSVLRAR